MDDELFRIHGARPHEDGGLVAETDLTLCTLFWIYSSGSNQHQFDSLFKAQTVRGMMLHAHARGMADARREIRNTLGLP